MMYKEMAEYDERAAAGKVHVRGITHNPRTCLKCIKDRSKAAVRVKVKKASIMTLRAVRWWYGRFNRASFRGSLTSNVTIRFRDLEKDNALAMVSKWTFRDRKNRKVQTATIDISKRVRFAQRLVLQRLFHEMVHIAYPKVSCSTARWMGLILKHARPLRTLY